MEDVARELQTEIDSEEGDGNGVFRHMLTSVGQQPYQLELE